jgi:hypothetical protein
MRSGVKSLGPGENSFSQAKCPDARRPRAVHLPFRQAILCRNGLKPFLLMYAATTKDEGNAADGCFSTACLFLT